MFEYVPRNLLEVLEERPGGLDPDLVRRYTWQLVKAVAWCHRHDIVHRDIKPENLLVGSDDTASDALKLCDFGFARQLKRHKANEPLTDYVATRWYRAPELLYLKQYSEAIDIWSAGCIFAEILGRKAFLQGKNYQDQLNVIFQVVGPPTEQDLEVVPNPEVRDYIRKMIKPGHKQVPLRERFPKASDKALDLLHKMLAFNPHHRPSAADCLAHPYLSEYHDPEDEPESPETFEWEFEGVTLSKDEIRAYMLESVRDIASRLNTSPFLG